MTVPGKHRDEGRELRAISLYLCDRVRVVLADGMRSCVIWPFEVLDPLVTKPRQEALGLFDLRRLSTYFSDWNEFKRVGLVLSDGNQRGGEKFALHRRSTDHNTWVLQTTRSNMCVVLEDQVSMRVCHCGCQDATPFCFARPLSNEDD
ncbi:hypothetical protein BBJ28_00002917 [Nothophytophthora sp. Chile5]|nr:hypothetical protein BBJ28_00002917 [Nothophytophthora sp. Chile5]